MRQLTGGGRAPGTGARGRGAALAGALGLAALGACAQASPPPGGPPDPLPPAIESVSPDSGSIGRPREVVFQFDEVVSERPTRGSTLAALVQISPYHGEPEVRWRRTALAIRPPDGWRDSTVYIVRLLPGVADLRGNVRDSAAVTVFSTGGPIPQTRVTGVLFDWMQGRALPDAWVQAITLPDSTIYVASTDSSGRFEVPFVPAGELLVRGIADQNRNFAVDPREAWDTVRVTLRDSARVELYAFVHDTLPVGIAGITLQDSVTLQVELDKPLALSQAIDTALVALYAPDSTRIPVAAVLSQRVADSLRAAADSARAAAAADSARAAAPADTAARDTLARPAPAAPPAARPPLDSAAARDSARRAAMPVPSRPTPVSRLVVRVARPLAPGAGYRLELRDAENLMGVRGTRDRTFAVPEAPVPTPPDTGRAAPPDTGAGPGAAPAAAMAGALAARVGAGGAMAAAGMPAAALPAARGRRRGAARRRARG